MNDDATPSSGSDHGAEEQELCVQCMTGNRPGSHFCRNCGAPLSSYAATGPFESLFAEGHLYRRAAEQPQRLIVVVGIWVIFGLAAAGGTLMAVMTWDTGNPFELLVGLGLTAVSVLLIWKTTKNYRNRPVVNPVEDG
jgi:hypothetical protein